MAGKLKVEMRTTSWSTQRGDVVEVDREVAERLIFNQHATGVSPTAKQIEADVSSESPEA